MLFETFIFRIVGKKGVRVTNAHVVGLHAANQFSSAITMSPPAKPAAKRRKFEQPEPIEIEEYRPEELPQVRSSIITLDHFYNPVGYNWLCANAHKPASSAFPRLLLLALCCSSAQLCLTGTMPTTASFPGGATRTRSFPMQPLKRQQQRTASLRQQTSQLTSLPTGCGCAR
jgi:hypothetical protein